MNISLYDYTVTMVTGVTTNPCDLYDLRDRKILLEDIFLFNLLFVNLNDRNARGKTLALIHKTVGGDPK